MGKSVFLGKAKPMQGMCKIMHSTVAGDDYLRFLALDA